MTSHLITPEGEAALADLAPRMAAGRHQGACAECAEEGLLYREEPTDPESRLVCADCARRASRKVSRFTPCDNDPSHGAAWRNPRTRRNEYLCGNCHGDSGEVFQNRWAPRVSEPLPHRPRPVCEAANVPGTKPCNGNVKPRGTGGVLLCNQHAGKNHPV